MLESLLWGLVASSSLVIGGVIALPLSVGVLTTVGFATAFAVSAFE